MANANVARTMQSVSVSLYKVTKLPRNGESRTHYSWTLKQADRAGAITLDEDGKVTSILEENLKFDLPKGIQLEDIMHPDFLKQMDKSE